MLLEKNLERLGFVESDINKIVSEIEHKPNLEYQRVTRTINHLNKATSLESLVLSIEAISKVTHSETKTIDAIKALIIKFLSKEEKKDLPPEISLSFFDEFDSKELLPEFSITNFSVGF